MSADGRLAVVSCGLNGLFGPPQFFDLTDGRCLYSLPIEPGFASEAVGLSPDGKILAIKDNRYLVFLDAASGKELRKLKYIPDFGAVRWEGMNWTDSDWLRFTPDGKQMAARLTGNGIQLIDVETAQVVRTFAPGAAVTACVFSPDSKWMATAGYGVGNPTTFARLWEVSSGKELRIFPVRFPVQNPIKRVLAFSPDGAMLAGGGLGDRWLHLWETATGKELKVFPGIGPDIVSVAFAPDGRTVAAAADNIHLYDPATGKERLRIERRAGRLAFSRDGSVLTGAVSGAIYRWDPASGRQLTPAAALDSAVEQILVSSDGRSLFTTDQDDNLYRWDTAGGKPPHRIAEGVKWGVVASWDRRFLAWTDRARSRNSRIRLYDIAADRFIDPVLQSRDGFPIIEGEACVAAFLPDGKSLLMFERSTATFRLWDIESAKERGSFTIDSQLRRARPFCTNRRSALSPDGKMLAIGPEWPEDIDFRPKEEGVPVRLWDVATGKVGHLLNEPVKIMGELNEAAMRGRGMKPIDGRAFSPDGRFLADWAENPFGAPGSTTSTSGRRRQAGRSRPSRPARRTGQQTRPSRPTDGPWPPPRLTGSSVSGRWPRGRSAPSSVGTGTGSPPWRLARTDGCSRAGLTPSSWGGTSGRRGPRPEEPLPRHGRHSPIRTRRRVSRPKGDSLRNRTKPSHGWRPGSRQCVSRRHPG